MHATHSQRRARFSILGTFLVLAFAVLAACGTPGTPAASSPPSASIPNVRVVAKDYSFDIPKGIHAGLNAITTVNQGNEPHQAQLLRLNDGVTLNQFTTALQKGPDAALGLITVAGGVNAISPGKQQTAVVDLAAGQYVMTCFVSSPDGHMHAEKGMLVPFTVEAAPAGSAVPSAPKADANVTLQDFSFQIPTNLTAGDHTLKVTNNGPQSHEMTLVKLDDGKTMQDMMAFMMQNNPSGQPPFSEAGGMGALAPNTSAWLNIHLEKGTYVAMCFVPDSATGKAHAEMGMVQQFTVQ